MRLGEIKKVASRQSEPRGAEPASAVQAAGRRDLVALTPAAPLRMAPENYCQAPFIAQLLAIKDQHPQTRERRRAEPGEALAAYRATAALTGRV
jgi:hypothetical protein